MSEVGSECCPICWREYCSSIKPILIVCGHTFCSDCLTDVRCCPLCRARIPARYPGATNYSLLSLIENKSDQPLVQSVDVQTQTEWMAEPMQLESELVQPATLKLPRASAPRKARQSIKFKLVRDGSGVLDGLELTLC